MPSNAVRLGLHLLSTFEREWEFSLEYRCTGCLGPGPTRYRTGRKRERNFNLGFVIEITAGEREIQNQRYQQNNMSDHEEIVSGSGYSTPIPELDDHRHPSPPLHRDEHIRHYIRRGTYESQVGERTRTLESDSARTGMMSHSGIRFRDFEEAVIDDDGGEISPMAPRRQRRGTVDTTASSREGSPPNSVKAFAMARRPPALSFSENHRPDDLQRTMSMSSRHSHRSKSRTAKESDVASIKTNRSAAEDDVCFPHETRGDSAMYIDYEYLEDFIRDQRSEREEVHRRSVDMREFPNLQQRPTADSGRVQMATADGDIIDIPVRSSIEDEKVKDEKVKDEKVKRPGLTQAPTEPAPKRFTFFSNSWDTTVHSADLEGLVLPGDEIRSLFTFPDDGEDYVWWLNVNCPTDEEVRAICKAFGIHPLTIEDIITHEAREKIELFKSYYFANFRSYMAVTDEDGDREFEPFNMFVIVFRDGILSFSHTYNSHASEVIKRISTLKDYVDLSSDWICYAIM